MGSGEKNLVSYFEQWLVAYNHEGKSGQRELLLFLAKICPRQFAGFFLKKLLDDRLPNYRAEISNQLRVGDFVAVDIPDHILGENDIYPYLNQEVVQITEILEAEALVVVKFLGEEFFLPKNCLIKVEVQENLLIKTFTPESLTSFLENIQ